MEEATHSVQQAPEPNHAQRRYAKFAKRLPSKPQSDPSTPPAELADRRVTRAEQ